MLYLVGVSKSCGSGMHIVDVSNPLEPTFVACFSDDGYTHDAHCVTYRGPDEDYYESEICFCFNEDTVTIGTLRVRILRMSSSSSSSTILHS